MVYHVVVCFALMAVNAFADDNPEYSKFLQQGRDEIRSGLFAAAETSFLNALRALEPNDQRERALTLTALGNVYANEDELLKAEKAYTEALTIYKRFADERDIALLLRHVAAVYSLERRDDDALRLLQQALKLTKANHDADIEVEVLNITGVVYYRQGKN